MLVALFSLPIVAAEPVTADASLAYASATLLGNITGQEDPGSFLFLPPSVAKRANVTIAATSLIVNWTENGRYEVMDPRNQSRPEYSMEKGPPAQGEKNHGTATAEADLNLMGSNLLALGFGDDLPTIGFESRTVTVQANPKGEWIGGAKDRGTAGQSDASRGIIRFTLPNGASQTELEDGRIRVTGNLTLHLWDTWLNVTDGQTTTTYRAGWEERSSTGPAGSVVQERQSRLLTLRMVKAEVVLTLDSGRALLVSPRSAITASGQAHLTSTLGSINNHMILDEPIDVRGDFRLESTNGTSGDNRMRGLLSYRAEVTSIQAGTAQIIAPASPSKGMSAWWLVAASVPVLLVGTVAGIRRYGPVTLDDVEYAILSGHDRRAHRSARRLAKKTPRDPDAVFLYATTLLQRKDFKPLLENIEPLAANIPKPERRGIAFVLAVASHALGDKQRSAKWGAEAAREPLLAQKLEESGVGSFKPGPSRFTQSGYA